MTDPGSAAGIGPAATPGTCPSTPLSDAGQVDPAVLQQQRAEVLAVEELDADHRVELAEAAQLPVLLAHQALASVVSSR